MKKIIVEIYFDYIGFFLPRKFKLSTNRNMYKIGIGLLIVIITKKRG
jgi:hypothetical protein